MDLNVYEMIALTVNWFKWYLSQWLQNVSYRMNEVFKGVPANVMNT